MRSAMNAIFYLLRTGCPWRYLPRDGFPPRSTVCNIFRKFQREGVWEAIWAELYAALRERLGHEASPTAAVLDSQTLKSAQRGRSRQRSGFWCRKEAERPQAPCPRRHRGSVARVVVHSAGIQDRDGAALVLDKIRGRFPWLELVWADGGYNAHQVETVVATVPVLRMEIVKRSDDMKGFVVLPRRWVVERTFSWFGRNRRLAKDFENLADTLAAFVTLASIQLALRRLART
jgi:putative transposase